MFSIWFILRIHRLICLSVLRDHTRFATPARCFLLDKFGFCAVFFNESSTESVLFWETATACFWNALDERNSWWWLFCPTPCNILTMDNCIGWQGLSYCTDSQYNILDWGTKLTITTKIVPFSIFRLFLLFTNQK